MIGTLFITYRNHCLIVLYLSSCVGCYGLEKCLKEFDLIDIEAGSKLYSLGLRFQYALLGQYFPAQLFPIKFFKFYSLGLSFPYALHVLYNFSLHLLLNKIFKPPQPWTFIV
jgi:hypothetical protein